MSTPAQMRPPRRRPPPPGQARFELEELEARLLLAADPLLGALTGSALVMDPNEAPPATVQVLAQPPRMLSQTQADGSASSSSSQDAAAQDAVHAAREVVFIDVTIPDADVLLQDLQAQRDAGRPLDVERIEAGDDGIAVITAYLEGVDQGLYDAVHILSHGDEAGLELGTTRLDQAALASRLGDISRWSQALTQDADVMLYGCNLAASDDGRELIGQLSLLSGADVAASDDLTGAAVLQGDWVLEYQTGHIETATAISWQAQAQWQQVLATITFQEGVSSYTGTQDTYLDKATPTTSRATSTSLMVDDGTPNDMQTLIRFDNIIGSGTIPLGSTITSASLTVYVTNHDTADTIWIHKMLASWSEASTYNSMVNGIATDDVEAGSATLYSLDAGISGAATFTNLASTVQAWANGGTNNGWALVTGDSNADAWTIVSSEGATSSQRPKLSVTYTAPTPPVVDLDSSGAGSGFSTTFTEGGAAVKIADTDGTVTAGSNTINTALSSMTVTITNLLDGTAESLAATTTGTNITASYNSATGVLSLTGTDTAANYQTVLRTITYSNSSDNPTTTSRTITVVAADPYGGSGTAATCTMAITAVNDAPVITSNGGGASASVSVAETLTAVTTVTASDPDGSSFTYSLSGGADQAKFSINSTTGVLTFVSAPDFESPTDVGANNVYDVIVRVSDGSLTDTQAIAVTVTDVSSTLVVTTTTDNNDVGLGTTFTAEQLNARTGGTDSKVSLREAIIAANNTAGTDTISFNLTGATGSYGEYTITMATTLPDITDAVYINGASQSGYTNRPLVVLDGEGGSANGLTLTNTADGSTIRGLLIRDFAADGIHINSGSDNHTIVGNFIGSFNADGSDAGSGERNLSEGIESYGANVTIGGTTVSERNVISGNASAYNIYLATGADGTTIKGNYIGTDSTGSTAFASTNSTYGIMVESSSTNITIGGTASGAGNVISGFTNRGIWVTTTGTTTVQGNYIGTDATGSVDLGNGGYGLYIDDTGSVTVGGTSTYAGNVISGNDGGGIYAGNSGSVTIQGNIIGLNASGTAALGNTGVGIYLSASAQSTVGGNGSGYRNVISGNSSHGIDVRSSPASGHIIRGNYIGVAANGTTLLGNGGAGVYIAASNVTVGGKTSGDGNIIAGNGAGGIVVASGNNNLFYRNSIYSNTGLGIDLGNDGVTANDYNDGDGGANYSNNFPVITSVVTNGSTTRITGSIEWYTQAQPVYIEFFSNTTADATGHGEGKTYLGYVQVTTDASTGDASFSLDVTGVTAGDWITAVANVEAGAAGASEFALAVQAVSASSAPRGRAIWNINDRFYQQYVEWSSAGFGGIGTDGLSYTDDISMITAIESPTRNETLFIGSADASGKILAGIWNGSTWSSVISIPLASPSATASLYDSFAAAYDEVSGNAMLVWDNGNTGTTGLSYATWNGSSWSAINTITAPVSGEPVHMQMAASPRAQEMVLVVETTAASSNQYAIVWNGSSWGNSQTLGTNSSKQYFEINVAYEQQSGKAMVVYDASAANASELQYRTWSGSAWSSEATLSAPAGITATSELYSTVIASDPTSNRIAIAAKNAANEVWLSVWNGSSWGSSQAATTSGVALTDAHPTMDVAFESQSGDLLAVYGKAAGPNIYYRTWTSGGGWSAEGTGPSMGGTDVPYIIKLYSDPYSNTIMLGAQDAASDLNMVTWSGTAWGSVTELDAATGFTYRENFTYVWYRDAAVITNLSGDTLSYTEGDAATVIDQGGNATVVLDSNGGFATGGSLTVSFAAGSTSAEDVLGIRNQGSGAGQIGVSGGNITYGGTVIGSYTGGSSGSNLVITLNSAASDAALTALVRNITYANTNTAAPSTTSRTVRYSITNALGHSSANFDATVSVSGANDAPTNTVPTGQNTNEDTNLVFSSGNGNLISIADVDAGSGSMQVSLSVLHGAITLSGTTGLSFSVGDGTSDAAMTFTGTISAINTALAGMSYLPTGNYNGTDTLSIVTSDQGNSGVGGALSDSDTVAITIAAVNDAPVITSNGGGSSASVNVAENSTAVTTVGATDVEGSALTYSISGGADAAKFTINASTGALSFVSAPNYESPTDTGANNVYDLIVTVTDGLLTDTQSIAVTVTPVNDNTPVITSNGGGATASVSIAENSTAVTTVTATDADLPAETLTYTISGGADAALFTVNASTGALSFTSARNREVATDANSDHIYEVTVQVSDGSNTDTQAISVTITDVDEFNVGAVTDGNASANTVAENAANGSTVGLTASASDADATTNTITYSLTDSAGGRFAINASTGVVTVANGTLLNYEAVTSHSITVLATSADGSSSSQSFTINVGDVDEFDVGAVSDSNAAANSLAENSANGTAVGITASASDADGSNNTITYSLSDSAGGRFAINASTGVVTVANSTLLNYEAATSHSITVLATSADGSSSSQSFTINLTDVDEFDVGAVSDGNAAANTVAENAANGSTVGITASASDADATTNTITYSLTDSAGGRFAINASTGVVTVANGTLLNYESATSHNITVRATSADGSISSQTFTINLSDVDEFDVGAVSDSNAAANTVAENAANGSTVGITASASDADGTTNTITYSLSDSAPVAASRSTPAPAW
ncbi:MAG: cadherin domain-containing protein [Aquabacterium sp.]